MREKKKKQTCTSALVSPLVNVSYASTRDLKRREKEAKTKKQAFSNAYPKPRTRADKAQNQKQQRKKSTSKNEDKEW